MAEPQKISSLNDAAEGMSFTYKKWEDIDEDAALVVDEDKGRNDEKTDNAKMPMRFDPGASKFDIVDVCYTDKEDLVDTGVRVKKLAQAEQEVWQVVIRKLRVWSAASTGADEGVDAVPCRPYCVMINSLYPNGRMLFQQVCEPPEEIPSPSTIISYVVQAMLNPMFGEQRRPWMLTFVEGDLAGQLYNSFEKWGIQVTQVSESEGVDDIVMQFSELLVRKQIATVGPTSEQPGQLEQYGVSVELLRAFYETAAKYAAEEPWSRIHERKSFKVVLEEEQNIISPDKSNHLIKVPAGTVWISVLGYDAYTMIQETGKGRAGNGAFGIAVFFSKLDLQSRLVPPQEELFVAPPGVDRCSYTGKTPMLLGHDLKRTKPRKVDIRTGEELMYKDADALRAHWPTVRKYAIELSELEKGRATRRTHWLGTECTVLFENPTNLPFNDLDAIDRYNLPLSGPVDSLGPCLYPLSLQFIKGKPERPDASQLVWLEWALQLGLEMLEQGLAENVLINPDTEITIETSTVPEGSVTLKITPEPVYFVTEANAAAMKKSTPKSNLQEKDEAEEENDEDHLPEEEESKSGGGCIIA